MPLGVADGGSFSSMGIRMGSEAILNLNRSLNILAQRQGSEDYPKHQGFLVGNIHKELLVIGGFQDADFCIGDNLVIRLVLESEAVGFVTTVKEIAKAPLKLYFVAFPDRVESVNLRKSLRLTVFFPAEIRAKKPAEQGADVHLLQAMVLNISGGGCFFTTKNATEPFPEVNLSFSLPGEKLVHSVRAEVLHSTPRKAITGQRVKFAEIVENVAPLADINRWVEQHSSFVMA